MGVGETSIEKGVRKYALEVVDILDPDRSPDPGEPALLSAIVEVQKTGDSSEPACRLRRGDPVYLLLDGAPDEAGCLKVVAHPNTVLGRLEDIRAQQIALQLLMGAVYRGEIIDVVPGGSKCQFIVQLRRCVLQERNEP